MFRIEGIEKIAALNRITEIQQQIKEIEKKFGTTANNFQTTLEKEMAKQADKIQNIKPIEEFLAENQLPPVTENVAANIEKVSAALNSNVEKVSAALNSKVETFAEKISEENLPEENLLDAPFADLRAAKKDFENISQMSTEQMILSAARKFGVDSELVKAVATAESNLNQDARSAVGAIGVMQLMPETADNLGVDPYDEKENIEGGAHYLRQMLDKFQGNLQQAIAAYNAGPGAVQKYGGVPPYSETQNYVGRVLDFYVK